MLEQIVAATGDQRAVLSAVGLTELVHGIYRAQTAETRHRRDAFIRELLNDVDVYPYTKETALLAGKTRRRAAEPRRHDSVRRSADRRYGAGGGLLSADRQCAPLPNDSRPVGDAAVVPALRVPKSLLCTCRTDYNQQ